MFDYRVQDRRTSYFRKLDDLCQNIYDFDHRFQTHKLVRGEMYATQHNRDLGVLHTLKSTNPPETLSAKSKSPKSSVSRCSRHSSRSARSKKSNKSRLSGKNSNYSKSVESKR